MSSKIIAPTNGVASGIVDLGDAVTADWITAGSLSLQHSVLFGRWPSSGQADSNGTLYVEADYFRAGPGAVGNDIVSDAALVLPTGFNQTAPGWVPVEHLARSNERHRAVRARRRAALLRYRRRLPRGLRSRGPDWTAGWTAYPQN